ncbi:MAG TPA: HEAT repeat domain-containing protein [Vicinamibacterales bacterium]
MPGAPRRSVPALFGCGFGDGASAGCVANVDSPPLRPGQRRTVSFLLTGYDLLPGRYQLATSGAVRLYWAGTTDVVPATTVEQAHSFTVRDATALELRAVLEPLIAAAGVASPSDPEQWKTRQFARQAIAEVAPPFLAQLLARFARERTVPAVDALRRIATAESTALLHALLDAPEYVRREAVHVRARIADPADTTFFANLLRDANADLMERRSAALALGKIGGDTAVSLLESAATGAATLRGTIVTALGHTRSPLAVPAIIRISDDDTYNEMCSSLRVLTHRAWCIGTPVDHQAQARRWLREWNERAPGAVIYGLDDCEDLESEERKAHEAAARARVVPVPAIRPSEERPRITSLEPARPSPDSRLLIRGHSLGARDSSTVLVRLRQGTTVHDLRPLGSGWSSKDGIERSQHLEVHLPGTMRSGPWQIEVESGGALLARADVTVGAPARLVLARVEPPQAHPSQLIEVETQTPPLLSDMLELTDSRGTSWPITPIVTSSGFMFELPARVAEGIVELRARRKEPAGDYVSPPHPMHVTMAPLPLPLSALRQIGSLAPGQFVTIRPDANTEFELRRVDRVEFEFQQGVVRVVVEANGQGFTRFALPSSLKPGKALARSRTWIEQRVSEWSMPVVVQLSKDPAPVSILLITAANGPVWWPDGGPRFMFAERGQRFEMSGEIPIDATQLRVHLVRGNEVRALPVVELRDSFQFTIPLDLPNGDWRLRVGAADRSTPTQDVTLVRIE